MADNKEREQLIGSILDELSELEMLTKGMQDPRMLEELAVKKAKTLLLHYEQLQKSVNREEKIAPKEEAVAVTTPKPVEASTKTETEIKEIPQKAEAEKPEPIIKEEKKAAPAAETVIGTEVEVESKPKEEKPVAEAVKPAESKQTAPQTSDLGKQKTGTAIGGGKGISFIDSIPVKSLKGAITMGDKFRYNTELFKGDMRLLNSTLEELDRMNNLGEALSYINAHFNWDKENEAYIDFMALLERRFENRI